MPVAPQETLIDQPHQGTRAYGLNVLQGLTEEGVGAATAVKLSQIEATSFEQIEQPIIGITKKVVRHLVPRPVKGDAQYQAAARLQHASHFAQRAQWFGDVFKNFCAHHSVETGVCKRKVERGRNNVWPGAVRKIVGPDVFGR